MAKKRPRRPAPSRRRPTPPTKHRHAPLTADTTRSPRENAWCREYARHHNATRAARDVGYTGSGISVTAFNLKHAPHMQAGIADAEAERLATANLNWDVVLNLLYNDAIDGELKPRDRHRAAEILGKHLGKFGDPIDDRPNVPAFLLPVGTAGVSVH